jgi:hypothetical protein
MESKSEKPNWLDFIIYRLFAWWWNPILEANPSYALALAVECAAYLDAQIELKFPNKKIVEFLDAATLISNEVKAK